MLSANVLSIQALVELKSGLARFHSKALESLNATEIEVPRVQDWLQERLNYWRVEVRQREEVVKRAWAALERCQSARYTDPKTGRTYVPPCIPERQALHRAKVHLAEAQAELRNVQDWMRLLQQAIADYRRQTYRLKAWLSSELPKANAFLEHKITTLQSYAAMGVSSGSYVTTPPVRAIGDTFASAVGLAALGVGLAAAAVYMIRWLAKDEQARHLKGLVGEELSAQLLREQPGFREVPFDPPKHGFDRVLTARGLPLIVLESKVTSNGAFRPRQTRHGEQGSPEWIAAQTEKMSDPTSKQYSPANERIAALINELGPENVPSVAVVIQSDTGLADVYVRPVGAEEWRSLQQGVALAEVLGGVSSSAGHPEASGDVERERGPESPETSRGGPERG